MTSVFSRIPVTIIRIEYALNIYLLQNNEEEVNTNMLVFILIVIFLAITPVPLSFQNIYLSHRLWGETVSGRLSPLGGAQVEMYWIRVKSKTFLGHGGSGLSFSDLERD